MPAPLVLLGALGSLAAIATLMSPKRRATSAPLRNWTGTIGSASFEVTRNGANWAWRTTTQGSGSAATAKLAIMAAARAIYEGGATSPSDGMSLRSTTGDVVAGVGLAGGGFIGVVDGEDGWGFQVVPPQGEAIKVTGIATRGAAALQLLDTIEPFTDGSA